VPGDGAAWTTPGADLRLSAGLPGIYDALPHERDRKDLGLFLGLLDSPAGGLVLFGRPSKFTDLAPDQRAAALLAMERNRVEIVRKGVRALKTLAAFLWVTTDDPSRPPPAWAAMRYPGPDGPPSVAIKPIQTEAVHRDTTIDCDVVVVGSGAGGGIAAALLAAAGLDVTLLERGGYNDESDFTHLESDAYRSMYLDGGLGSTSDGGVLMLAGSTLGGGTVVNYTTSLATPDQVREEWDRVAGFPEVFSGDDYLSSLASVQERMDVNRDNGLPSVRDQVLEKGIRNLGWHLDEMPRNASGCTEEACGYCTMGCRVGAKRSTLATYLQDAAEGSVRFIVDADARLVVTERGRATGVVARVRDHDLTVRASTVVLAAGALNTPALLLRSGLGGPAAGRYLRLHPVTAAWGRFEERIDPWTGTLQTRYSDEFANLDGHGYGFRFETAPVHPLFPAAYVGWEDGPSFKRDVLGLGHLGVAGILLRDRDHGRVVVRRDGSPLWKYRISSFDQAHVREGVRRAAELLAAAGAVEVFSSTIRPVRWVPGQGTIDGLMAGVDAVGYGPNQTSYLSFHQMGSARMGSDPSTSVVDAENQAHDTAGLYVMDGSCFPTASGVNPMISIAAIAHRGATRLAERIA
ncbi:MAG TPA: GMC family oxidoreductase N-terminal domain-containing protein, partial [Acidimicrobiia bacterium]|nr:GMC family oxidoreductase N-terminal domain-containing protein [Acidimicrobiia bacterium]